MLFDQSNDEKTYLDGKYHLYSGLEVERNLKGQIY